MKIPLLFLCICFLALPQVFARTPDSLTVWQPATQPESAPIAPWHRPDAPYRLEIQRDLPDVLTMVDLRRLLLPILPEKNVEVVDPAGKNVSFFLAEGNGILLLPPGTADSLFLYYGHCPSFSSPPEGSTPDPERLRIRIVNARNLAPSEGEWLENRRNQYQTRYTRQWDANALGIERLFRETLTGPTLFCRYPGETWRPRTYYLNEKNMKMRMRQQKSKAVRPRWRYRPGYLQPIWFFPLHQRYLHSRRIASLRNSQNILNRWGQDLAKAEQESVGAPEREILEVFSNPRHQLRGDGLAREINLPKRPFDSDGNFAIRYTGNLLIPQDGEYEFSVVCNSLSLLRLDGKTVLSRFGVAAPSEVKPIHCRLRLSRGLHPFELYYHKSRVTSTISATWKKPGESQFHPLIDDDFAPGYPARLLASRNREGGEYPLVMRDDRYLLHPGKLERRDLESYRVLKPAGLSFDWQLNGEKLPGNQLPALILPHEGESRLTLVPHDTKWLPLPVLRRPAMYDHQVQESGISSSQDMRFQKMPYEQVSLDPAVSLKLWLPLTLYDDEIAGMDMELRSGLPLPLQIRLRQRPDHPQDLFPEEERYFRLAAKPEPHLDRFAPDITRKIHCSLPGAELLDGLTVEYELAIPDFVFAREIVRFLPVSALPADLTASPEGLRGAAGERIVPILRRPDLHQLRAWELPKTIDSKLHAPSKLLVIAEDFGTGSNRFSRHLAELCRKRGWELEFYAWSETDTASGSRLLDTLPTLLPRLGGSPADTAIVVPPPRSRNQALAQWENLRLLALVLEKLQGSSSLRELYLATPLPSGEVADTEVDTAFENELRRLRREYGTGLLEYNLSFRDQPDWRNSYRLDVSGDVFLPASYPESDTLRAAECLLKCLK